MVAEQQGSVKRTARDQVKVAQASELPGATSRIVRQQPMLLNDELIEKLMSNKTLVNLMSSQLKRVIDSEKMNEQDKQRLVRQVFEQMMEEKVDFSMNNVRLAVKTVSSSYRAAAAKQQQQQQKQMAGESLKPKQRTRTHHASVAGFGRRASGKEQHMDSMGAGHSSKSFTAIDTALKLTSGKHKKSSAQNNNSTIDASGNPIVVVLLPQEKA